MAKQAVTKQDTFTTSSGLAIKIQQVDPMFLQKVINSVHIPKAPTYEVTTISGRKETHIMDAKSAAETPGGEETWENYVLERDLALRTQNDRLMNALFYMGTECEIPVGSWERKWAFLGIDVPSDPDERRAFYLTSELPTEETVNLMSAVLRLTGVDAELLQQAEDAFRDSVPDRE